jgi:hypothetical protein
VEVSNVEDHATKKSSSDDVGDVGASSVEPIAPGPIRSDVLGQTDPFATDRAASTTLPIGRRRHKHPPPFPKRK